MPGDVVRRLAAAGGVADMDGVPQIEMLDHGGDIGGVVVHVVAVADLARAAMAAPVMRDDAVALADEVEHLGVPVVRAQRPAVMEDDGLRVPRTPVLVEDLDAVPGGDRAHLRGSSARGVGAGESQRRQTWLVRPAGTAALRRKREKVAPTDCKPAPRVSVMGHATRGCRLLGPNWCDADLLHRSHSYRADCRSGAARAGAYCLLAQSASMGPARRN